MVRQWASVANGPVCHRKESCRVFNCKDCTSSRALDVYIVNFAILNAT